MSTSNKLKVEVWSDIVCPFCYIGKRNYEAALKDFQHASEIELEWKSYQLDPDFQQIPGEQYDLTAGLAKKYNRPVEAIKQMQAQITESAKAVGLTYDFDKAQTFNTFDAHRVLQMAKEHGLGDQLEEVFFKAYFTDGKDLGNLEVLKAEAQTVGLSSEDIEKALTDDAYAYKVNQDIQEAYNIGVTGVPFFVFDRKYAVSGAQPPQAFLQTLEAAYKEWKDAQPAFIQPVSQGPSCDINGNCD